MSPAQEGVKDLERPGTDTWGKEKRGKLTEISLRVH
jgi:hypothetical protein